MPLSPVDLYEQLKPRLGEGETKALIEYVDGKIRGEVATKEDLTPLKEDIQLLKQDIYLLKESIQLLKQDMLLIKADLEKQIQGLRGEFKDETWKLRILVIVVLILQIVLNPKVVELVGRILGVVK